MHSWPPPMKEAGFKALEMLVNQRHFSENHPRVLLTGA